MVRSASRESHAINKVTGVYSNYQSKALIALLAYGKTGCSRRSLAHTTGIETATMPSIILPLIDRGLVEESEQKYTCPVTGRSVRRVRVVPGATL